MEADPEEATDDLISDSEFLARTLSGGVLESATPAQVNAIMHYLAQKAKKLATAYREEVRRRRALEEEAKSGLYLRGADYMANALVRAEYSAKQSRHWLLDASAIERRLAEARKDYDKSFYIKLALGAGFGAGLVVLALYALRRNTFYSLANSVLLLGAVGLLAMAAATWLDLTRRWRSAPAP